MCKMYAYIILMEWTDRRWISWTKCFTAATTRRLHDNLLICSEIWQASSQKKSCMSFSEPEPKNEKVPLLLFYSLFFLSSSSSAERQAYCTAGALVLYLLYIISGRCFFSASSSISSSHLPLEFSKMSMKIFYKMVSSWEKNSRTSQY